MKKTKNKILPALLLTLVMLACAAFPLFTQRATAKAEADEIQPRTVGYISQTEIPAVPESFWQTNTAGYRMEFLTDAPSVFSYFEAIASDVIYDGYEVIVLDLQVTLYTEDELGGFLSRFYSDPEEGVLRQKFVLICAESEEAIEELPYKGYFSYIKTVSVFKQLSEIEKFLEATAEDIVTRYGEGVTILIDAGFMQTYDWFVEALINRLGLKQYRILVQQQSGLLTFKVYSSDKNENETTVSFNRGSEIGGKQRLTCAIQRIPTNLAFSNALNEIYQNDPYMKAYAIIQNLSFQIVSDPDLCPVEIFGWEDSDYDVELEIIRDEIGGQIISLFGT